MPLPSLFFIGKNGTPIEIVTSLTKTVDELKSKIDKVLNRSPATASDAAASADFISSTAKLHISHLPLIVNKLCKFPGEQAASSTDSEETEIVCENGVCYKRPKVKTNEDAQSVTSAAADTTTTTTTAPDSQLSNEEKLERAKNLIEKKRKEKDEENERVSAIDSMQIYSQFNIELLFVRFNRVVSKGA